MYSLRLSIFPGRDRPDTGDSDSLSFDLPESISQAWACDNRKLRERGKRKRAGLKMQAGVRELRDSVRKARLAAASRDRAWSTRSVDHDLANLSISRPPPCSLSASPFPLSTWLLSVSTVKCDRIFNCRSSTKISENYENNSFLLFKTFYSIVKQWNRISCIFLIFYMSQKYVG